MKLNLGCGRKLLDGYVNVDVLDLPGVVCVNLDWQWPWGDGAVEEIQARHIFEHLYSKIGIMNEAWRVLKHGGLLAISLPTTDGPGAWQDPTHVSFWNRRSFMYYEDGNPYREEYAESYGIEARFQVVMEQTQETVDGPVLSILLRAVKEGESVPEPEEGELAGVV